MSMVSVSWPRVIARYTFGEQLGIQQCPVHRPVRVVDAETFAQRVEAVALAGEHLARQRQRVDQSRVRLRATGGFRDPEFGVEEGDVERRVVDDPLGAAREREELRRYVAKTGLALEIVPRHPVDFGRAGVDLPFRIQSEVHGAARRPTVDQLQRGDLDDAVALPRIEARGFGVDDDLAHGDRPGQRR